MNAKEAGDLAGAFDRVDNSEAIRRAVRDAAREGERRVIVAESR